MKTIIPGTIVAVLLLASRSSYAWDWVGTAASCKINPAAATLALVTAGSVKFNGTAVGDIDMYCQIPQPTATSPTTIWLVFQDNQQGGADVTVTYYRMSTTNGSITQIYQLDANNNDCVATTGAGLACESFTFTDSTYNTSSYYYYARIDIIRGDTSGSPVFYGTSLF
jgi:hypothetical protein